jgi:hypothetical protein
VQYSVFIFRKFSNNPAQHVKTEARQYAATHLPQDGKVEAACCSEMLQSALHLECRRSSEPLVPSRQTTGHHKPEARDKECTRCARPPAVCKHIVTAAGSVLTGARRGKHDRTFKAAPLRARAQSVC